MIGQRFNMLVVISEDAGRSASGNKQWLYRCDCGAEKVYRRVDVERGRVKSCGCYRKSGDQTRQHGQKSRALNGTPVYRSWRQMKTRCGNPNAQNFRWYGGRGIVVCDRWKTSFRNFLADMGEPPKGMTLDRIDTDGNYEPGNCRWASKVTQANNRRDTVRLELNGRSLTITELAAEVGISRNTLRQALYRRIKRDALPDK